MSAGHAEGVADLPGADFPGAQLAVADLAVADLAVADLAVIGGGVGGSACALAAARAGLSVVLFEPQPGPIDKPCGEGCLSSGVAALAELGLEALIARGMPLAGATYSMAGAPRLSVPFAAPGRALERRELAAALDLCLARERNVVRVAAAAHVERSEHGFVVHAGGERFAARALAVADGTRGRTASWLRGERWIDAGRFGLRARCEARESLAGVEILFGDAHGQIYVTPLPDRRLNVALLLDRAPCAGGAAAWFEHARAHPALARLAGDVVTPPEVRSLARRAPRAVARGGVFLVGDAAGGVDPVVGCGVSVALCTGLAAARAARELAGGRPPRAVESDYARVVHAETAGRARLAGVLLALARHPRWARAALHALARAPRLAAALARTAERAG